MDELNQALERMQKALELRRQSSGMLPTQPHGLTNGDGNRITQQSGSKPLEGQAGQARVTSYEQNTPQKRSASDKMQLMEILRQTCALQKAYGKTSDELETLVEGFSWALAEYHIDEITRAMAHYIKTNADIPAPANIIEIIEMFRKFDAAVNPSPEKLLGYYKKGVPITQAQLKILRESGLLPTG